MATPRFACLLLLLLPHAHATFYGYPYHHLPVLQPASFSVHTPSAVITPFRPVGWPTSWSVDYPRPQAQSFYYPWPWLQRQTPPEAVPAAPQLSQVVPQTLQVLQQLIAGSGLRPPLPDATPPSQVSQALSQAVPQVAQAAWQALPEVAQAAPQVAQAIAQAAPQVAQAVSQVAPELSQVASQVLPQVEQAVSQVAPELAQVASQVAPQLQQVVSQVAPELTQVASQVAPQVAQVVSQTAPELSQAISEAAPQVAQAVSLAAPELSQVASQVAPQLEQAVSQVAPELAQVASQVLPQVEQAVSQVAPELSQVASQVLPQVEQAVSQAAPELTQVASQVTPQIEQAVSQVAPDLAQVASQVLPQVEQAVSQVAPELSQVASQVLPQVEQAVSQAAPELTQVASQVAPQVAQAVSQAVPELSQAIPEAVPQVALAVSQAVPEVSQVASQVVTELSQVVFQAEPEMSQVVLPAVPEVAQVVSQSLPEVSQTVSQPVPHVSQEELEAGPDVSQDISQAVPQVSQVVAQVSQVVQELIDSATLQSPSLSTIPSSPIATPSLAVTSTSAPATAEALPLVPSLPATGVQRPPSLDYDNWFYYTSLEKPKPKPPVTGQNDDDDGDNNVPPLVTLPPLGPSVWFGHGATKPPPPPSPQPVPVLPTLPAPHPLPVMGGQRPTGSPLSDTRPLTFPPPESPATLSPNTPPLQQQVTAIPNIFPQKPASYEVEETPQESNVSGVSPLGSNGSSTAGIIENVIQNISDSVLPESQMPSTSDVLLVGPVASVTVGVVGSIIQSGSNSTLLVSQSSSNASSPSASGASSVKPVVDVTADVVGSIIQSGSSSVLSISQADSNGPVSFMTGTPSVSPIASVTADVVGSIIQIGQNSELQVSQADTNALAPSSPGVPSAGSVPNSNADAVGNIIQDAASGVLPPPQTPSSPSSPSALWPMMSNSSNDNPLQTAGTAESYFEPGDLNAIPGSGIYEAAPAPNPSVKDTHKDAKLHPLSSGPDSLQEEMEDDSSVLFPYVGYGSLKQDISTASADVPKYVAAAEYNEMTEATGFTVLGNSSAPPIEDSVLSNGDNPLVIPEIFHEDIRVPVSDTGSTDFDRNAEHSPGEFSADSGYYLEGLQFNEKTEHNLMNMNYVQSSEDLQQNQSPNNGALTANPSILDIRAGNPAPSVTSDGDTSPTEENSSSSDLIVTTTYLPETEDVHITITTENTQEGTDQTFIPERPEPNASNTDSDTGYEITPPYYDSGDYTTHYETVLNVVQKPYVSTPSPPSEIQENVSSADNSLTIMEKPIIANDVLPSPINIALPGYYTTYNGSIFYILHIPNVTHGSEIIHDNAGQIVIDEVVHGEEHVINDSEIEFPSDQDEIVYYEYPEPTENTSAEEVIIPNNALLNSELQEQPPHITSEANLQVLGSATNIALEKPSINTAELPILVATMQKPIESIMGGSTQGTNQKRPELATSNNNGSSIVPSISSLSDSINTQINLLTQYLQGSMGGLASPAPSSSNNLNHQSNTVTQQIQEGTEVPSPLSFPENSKPLRNTMPQQIQGSAGGIVQAPSLPGYTSVQNNSVTYQIPGTAGSISYNYSLPPILYDLYSASQDKKVNAPVNIGPVHAEQKPPDPTHENNLQENFYESTGSAVNSAPQGEKEYINNANMSPYQPNAVGKTPDRGTSDDEDDDDEDEHGANHEERPHVAVPYQEYYAPQNWDHTDAELQKFGYLNHGHHQDYDDPNEDDMVLGPSQYEDDYDHEERGNLKNIDKTANGDGSDEPLLEEYSPTEANKLYSEPPFEEKPMTTENPVVMHHEYTNSEKLSTQYNEYPRTSQPLDIEYPGASGTGQHYGIFPSRYENNFNPVRTIDGVSNQYQNQNMGLGEKNKFDDMTPYSGFTNGDVMTTSRIYDTTGKYLTSVPSTPYTGSEGTTSASVVHKQIISEYMNENVRRGDIPIEQLQAKEEMYGQKFNEYTDTKDSDERVMTNRDFSRITAESTPQEFNDYSESEDYDDYGGSETYSYSGNNVMAAYKDSSLIMDETIPVAHDIHTADTNAPWQHPSEFISTDFEVARDSENENYNKKTSTKRPKQIHHDNKISTAYAFSKPEIAPSSSRRSDIIIESAASETRNLNDQSENNFFYKLMKSKRKKRHVPYDENSKIVKRAFPESDTVQEEDYKINEAMIPQSENLKPEEGHSEVDFQLNKALKLKEAGIPHLLNLKPDEKSMNSARSKRVYWAKLIEERLRRKNEKYNYPSNDDMSLREAETDLSGSIQKSRTLNILLDLESMILQRKLYFVGLLKNYINYDTRTHTPTFKDGPLYDINSSESNKAVNCTKPASEYQNNTHDKNVTNKLQDETRKLNNTGDSSMPESNKTEDLSDKLHDTNHTSLSAYNKTGEIARKISDTDHPLISEKSKEDMYINDGEDLPSIPYDPNSQAAEILHKIVQKIANYANVMVDGRKRRRVKRTFFRKLPPIFGGSIGKSGNLKTVGVLNTLLEAKRSLLQGKIFLLEMFQRYIAPAEEHDHVPEYYPPIIDHNDEEDDDEEEPYKPVIVEDEHHDDEHSGDEHSGDEHSDVDDDDDKKKPTNNMNNMNGHYVSYSYNPYLCLQNRPYYKRNADLKPFSTTNMPLHEKSVPEGNKNSELSFPEETSPRENNGVYSTDDSEISDAIKFPHEESKLVTEENPDSPFPLDIRINEETETPDKKLETTETPFAEDFDPYEEINDSQIMSTATPPKGKENSDNNKTDSESSSAKVGPDLDSEAADYVLNLILEPEEELQWQQPTNKENKRMKRTFPEISELLDIVSGLGELAKAGSRPFPPPPLPPLRPIPSHPLLPPMLPPMHSLRPGPPLSLGSIFPPHAFGPNIDFGKLFLPFSVYAKPSILDFLIDTKIHFIHKKLFLLKLLKTFIPKSRMARSVTFDNNTSEETTEIPEPYNIWGALDDYYDYYDEARSPDYAYDETPFENFEEQENDPSITKLMASLPTPGSSPYKT